MLDMKFLRTEPDIVRENIRKKFQDEKLPLVDEVLEMDKQYREAKTRGDYLRSQRNSISKQIGGLMGKGLKEEAEKAKAQVVEMADELARLEQPGCPRFRGALSHRYHGAPKRCGFGQRPPHQRQRLLLPQGRYRPSPFGHPVLRPGFHD